MIKNVFLIYLFPLIHIIQKVLKFYLCLCVYIYIHTHTHTHTHTYIYQKATQKSTKAFEHSLRILLQLCCYRFCLIISEQKVRCKSQGTRVEKELFRMQSGMQTKYG